MTSWANVARRAFAGRACEQLLRALATVAMTASAALAGSAQPPYRAAVLADPALPVSGCPTPVRTFEHACARLGIPLAFLDARALADSARFDPDRYDLLIVPTGATFPVGARQALLAFLQRGGDLLCTGGYAFDNLVAQSGGKWVPYARILRQQEEAARAALIPNGDFSGGSQGWQADAPSQCAVEPTRAAGGRPCAVVRAAAVEAGARWGTQLTVEPGRSYLIGTDASTSGVTGPGFGFLAVYQYDQAGALVTFRDFAQIRATTPWQRREARIAIAPTAARVMFYGGMYLATGAIRFARVTCAPVPGEERINAHYGDPQDGLVVAPTQLPLYSPDQPIRGTKLVAAPGSGLPAGWRSPGPVAGCEATAQLRAVARWAPLVEVRDSVGRAAGAAGAFVHHSGGPFAGSNWAIFGVTSRDIFAGEAGQALLDSVLKRLSAHTCIDGLTTDLPIYRPGETATLRLAVSNGSRQAAEVQAMVSLAPPDGSPVHAERRPITLAPGGRTTLELPWRVPAGAPDLLAVTASLTAGGRLLDRAETGLCVYDERVTQSGPRITYRDNAFDLRLPGGKVKRVTLFGTDTWSSWFGSPSHSPLTWFREMQLMRDNGLHMYENLGFWTAGYRYDEKQWRQLDAVVQLSQRCGLPYMAGLLIGQNVVVDDAVLKQQADLCRAFAERYHGVPGLLYYLNGDFQLRLADTPDIRRLWNEFLAQRYPNAGALQAVWGASAVPGDMPVRDSPAGSWYDLRARDMSQFKASLVRRWVGALTAAIRSVDREHPITSEYYQRPTDGIDLRLTIDGQDAANFGYFDAQRQDIARLPATIKWNDMRRAGHAANMGEFGVKTHDAWALNRDPSGYHEARTERQQRELFWFVVHAALAYNVSKIQNWCFADDPDSIFPWGVAWRNPLRPKPVLKLWRNLRVFSDLVPRDDHAASTVMVMPDTWRVSAVPPAAGNGLMNAIECLLAANTAFDVVGEDDLERLAARPPRALVLPLAYAMPDAAVGALRRIAKSGATVYLSGDVSVAPDGSRSPDRLESLCGVRLAGEPGVFGGLPEPRIVAFGASALPTSAGLPVYRYRLGKGQVIYSPRPWEALPGAEVFVADPRVSASAARNLYLSLPRFAGVRPPVAVAGGRGAWRATVVPSGANRLVSLLPQAGAAAALSVALGARRWQVDTAAGLPCAFLVDRGGQVLAATGGRALRRDGAPIASSTQPWMLVALDGRPLGGSRALAATLMEDGRLRWRSTAAGLQAWLVEWRDGAARPVARVPVRRTGGDFEVTIPGGELVVICPTAELGRWLGLLKRP